MKNNLNMASAFFYTIITTLLITIGQVLWKLGIEKSGGFYVSDQTWIENIFRILFNYHVLIGFILYALATVFFMYLLALV